MAPPIHSTLTTDADPLWLEAEGLIGRVVDGRYRLEALVGVGGTAAVFRALHLGTEQVVALKALLPRSFGSRDQIARTLREARMAAKLRHPNVVDMRDVGMDRELPYIVMELFEGESLAERLGRTPALSVDEALALALPIAGALACAHDMGMVHRDLKPGNVFLARVGGTMVPKLLDFGLARGPSGDTITNSGTVVGTPAYMSPEQARGQPLGPTSDVWAMGTMLFHCLCGEPPFEGASAMDILLKVVSEAPPLLHHTVPSLPPALSVAVSRALQREPANRPQSMRVFARLLLDAGVQAGIRLPVNPDPVGLPAWRTWLTEAQSQSQLTLPQQASGTSEPVPVPAEQNGPRGSVKPRVWAGLLVLLLAMGLGGWWLTSSQDDAARRVDIAPAPIPPPASVPPSAPRVDVSPDQPLHTPIAEPTGPAIGPAPVATPTDSARPSSVAHPRTKRSSRAQATPASKSPDQPRTHPLFELDKSWP